MAGTVFDRAPQDLFDLGLLHRMAVAVRLTGLGIQIESGRHCRDSTALKRLVAIHPLLPPPEMRIQFRSFQDVLDGVRQARRWYEDLGVPTQGTRLELLEKNIGELSELASCGPSEKLLLRLETSNQLQLIADAAGFGKIARQLPKVGQNLLRRHKLRQIIDGPLDQTDERPSGPTAQARNIFTELELASDFLEKGLEIKGFDDLKFSFESRDASWNVRGPSPGVEL